MYSECPPQRPTAALVAVCRVWFGYQINCYFMACLQVRGCGVNYIYIYINLRTVFYMAV